MKRVVKASESVNLIFKVYFKDGNQQIFDAENIHDVLSYMLFVDKRYNATDIWRIEEIDD